jgi:Domain of unknown function (DUF4301)
MEKRPPQKTLLTADDIKQLKASGISEGQIRRQLAFFQNPPAHLTIDRPCTLGDGILKIPPGEKDLLIRNHEEAARQGRFQKFVPASGAATRMFQDLLQGYYALPALGLQDLRARARKGHRPSKTLCLFFSHLNQFALAEELRKHFSLEGHSLEVSLNQGRWQLVLENLLFQPGLNYCDIPKGLMKFHAYPGKSRTALEEHLVEAAQTIKDASGICRIQVTVSPDYLEAFANHVKEVKPHYEKEFDCRLEVLFSIQKPSSSTLAVDLNNRPVREKDGRLHLRPGGHGALLANLNDLQGDLVYIKNIDNILPDRKRTSSIIWKKILGGLLVETQGKIHRFLEGLKHPSPASSLWEEALQYAFEILSIPKPGHFQQLPRKDQKAYLINKLNRPLRVCGMVKNEGEPGGGPFFVKDREGGLGLQIVESSQINPRDKKQQSLWASSTHFNPVDLVCALRDYQGKLFDLTRHVDPEAVFITKKSKDGQTLKALELPGLWNGSMSDWITLFVEVPSATFSPVKSIMDLLKAEHLPERN